MVSTQTSVMGRFHRIQSDMSKATVAADVCTHLGKDAISGIIYLAPLPYVGPIMNDVGSPTILGFLPGLFTTEDMALSRTTQLQFFDSLFNNPGAVPFSLKCQWLGCGVLQSPEVRKHVLSREQDPAKLFEAGANGLPLLIMSGSNDRQVIADAVVRCMKPKFVNTTVEIVQGGGHALFVDNREEFINIVIKWTTGIMVCRSHYHSGDSLIPVLRGLEYGMFPQSENARLPVFSLFQLLPAYPLFSL